MLDEFLKVAYETQTRQKAHLELVGLMEGLPVVELRKLASGTAVAELYGHLDKTADILDACSSDGAPKTFLDKFKGTPLFEQAIALEQEELQAEMADTAKRQEERTRRASEDTLYDTRDRIRVQKRLLELELAKQEAGASAPPAPATPLPGAPAGKIPPPPPLGADAPPAPGADPSKTVTAAISRERMGELLKAGDAAGRALAKTANLAAIGGALKGLAGSGGLQKAMQFATKNPALVGAGIGAAGGAIAGGPGNRLAGAAGGAALGGAAGHAGSGILSRMNSRPGGMSFGDAAKGYLGSLGKTSPGGQASAGVLGGPALGGATLTPPNVMDFAKKDFLGRPKMAG